MKPSFLRMRRKHRAVLVFPPHLTGLATHLRKRTFLAIVLTAPLDPQTKEWVLPHRTFVTDKPEQSNYDDVPTLECSLIDISKIEADERALADTISRAWTKYRLKTEGWFVLRLQKDGSGKLEFPE
jgi:hypothetical protein